ncbi:MAG: hypothetical protein ABSE76_01440 [Minisyncoccia bacterium]|jgi:aldehyde:ferredoxin oxidoreductase
MLPEEALKEYREIYREIYGVELSDEEVAFRAANLLNLYRVVLKENHVEKNGII